MDIVTETLCASAIKLPPAARLELVDNILASLDVADPAIDRLWADEAESRLSSYRRGEIEAVSLAEVLAKHK